MRVNLNTAKQKSYLGGEHIYLIWFQSPKKITTEDLGGFLSLVQIQDHLVAESKAFLRRPLVVTRRQATHQ